MHRLTTQFVDYCKSHFVLSAPVDYKYQSLSVCLIDCIYSLRTNYNAVTIPIIDRYAQKYMNGCKNYGGDTISMLLEHIYECGGPAAFAETILKNHQELGGSAHIPKEEVLFQLANYLRLLHIETIEDFQSFESQELLEIIVHAVKGMGDAGTNYLFMLVGDTNRCKPDVHIHQCIKDACGEDVSNDECQIIFRESVIVLNKLYPQLSVRQLDGLIWRAYQKK